MPRTWRWVPRVTVLLLLGIGWFSLRSRAVPLKIGVIGPLPREAATYGLSQRNGAKLAAEAINREGGINGRPLELLFVDDANDLVQSTEVARDLIYRDKVLGLIGTVSSGNTMNIQRLADRARIPVLTAVSTNPFITRVHFSFTFRCLSDDNVQASEFARHTFHVKNLRRVAILHDSNKYGAMGAITYAEQAQRLGQHIIATEEYETDAVNFREQLSRIRQTNPDGLLIWGLVRESAMAVRQAREIGLNIPVFGGDGMASNAYLDLAGPSAEGTILTYPFNPRRPLPQTIEFLSHYREAFHKEADSFAAHGYDAVMLMARALRASGPDRLALRDALATINAYVGVTGPGGFDSTGNETRPVELAIVKAGQFIPLHAGGKL